MVKGNVGGVAGAGFGIDLKNFEIFYYYYSGMGAANNPGQKMVNGGATFMYYPNAESSLDLTGNAEIVNIHAGKRWSGGWITHTRRQAMAGP